MPLIVNPGYPGKGIRLFHSYSNTLNYMKEPSPLQLAYKSYLAKQKRNAIQHLVSGLGISLLMVHGVHWFDFIVHDNYTAFGLTIILGVIPVGFDFFDYYIKSQHELQSKLHELEEVSTDLFRSENKLMRASALSRIQKEIEILKDMKSNSLVLPSLQNFEYIREILGRILQKVMQSGDTYYTLSRLDFWTTPPLENPYFIKVNKDSVELHEKLINRIIVMDEVLLENLKKGRLREIGPSSLKKLILDFAQKFPHDFNYKSRLKTLFYFISSKEYEEIKKYLLSAVIVSGNFRDVMFVQVKNLKDIELANPKIDVKYFQFPNWKPDDNVKNDFVETLKSLLVFVRNENKGKNNSELGELISFLRAYERCFLKIRTIYDFTDGGERLTTIDLNKCKIFDLEMVSEYLELPIRFSQMEKNV